MLARRCLQRGEGKVDLSLVCGARDGPHKFEKRGERRKDDRGCPPGAHGCALAEILRYTGLHDTTINKIIARAGVFDI